MVWKYGLPAALSFVSCFAVAPALLGQAPAIESAGVQNAASNATLASLASQMLVTIKGHNLASSAAAASAVPLPLTLGGASVYFNGQAAPILYASPTQINVQAPYQTGQTNNSVVVTTAAGSSQPYALASNSNFSVGIFTQDAPVKSFNDVTRTGLGWVK